MSCPYATSGCNGPKEGECMTLCLHRINTQHMAAPVAIHMGRVEQRPEPTGRLALALAGYRRFRTANRTRAQALLHALRVLRQRT